MTKSQTKIACNSLNAMIDINPHRSINHHKEDFVFENFLDRCLEQNYNGNNSKLFNWFNKNKHLPNP